MMALAAVFAALSGVIGLYLSYYLSIASGAAIVLTATAIFLIAWGIQAVRHRLLAPEAPGQVGDDASAAV